MQKEGSDNDTQDEAKENERPAKRMRTDDDEENQVWESSMNFMVETPVSSEFIIKFKLNSLKMPSYKFQQSKTLASDSGVIFSPPSIMRDALDDSELYLNDDEDGVCFKRRNQEPADKVIEGTFSRVFNWT
jgi:hypothetical protein